MVMTKFTQADHALVTAAVARAELASDGEIVTIVADKSDSYHDVGLHYEVLAMLLVTAVFALVPRSCIAWALQPFLGWTAGLSRGGLMVCLRSEERRVGKGGGR